MTSIGFAETQSDKFFLDKAKYIIPKLSNIMKTIGSPSRENIHSNTFKVLVWNMYKADKPNWARDFRYLARGRDILLLQEMFLDKESIVGINMNEVLRDMTGYEFLTATSFIFADTGARTGVINASTIESKKVIPVRSRPREPIVNTPKMGLITYYDLEGSNERLLVANIHAVNFVSVFALDTHVRQLTAHIKRHKGPVIYAGDFNTWSIGKLQLVERAMKEVGLKAVTWKKDTRMRTLGQPLDHVYYRGLKVVTEKVWGEIEGSDHKALEVEFSL